MRSFRRVVAGIAAVAVGMGMMTAGVTAASAAPTAGVTASVMQNGTAVTEGQVVNEGDLLKLRVQYDGTVTPPLAGQTVTFEIADNVTLTGVPAGNNAVESFSQNGNAVVVKFMDEWPAGVGQGFFDLEFTVNDVGGSSTQDLSWNIGDESFTLPLVVRNSGDDFENVQESFAKGGSLKHLNGFVEMENSVFEGLNKAIIGQHITYTLTVNTRRV